MPNKLLIFVFIAGVILGSGVTLLVGYTPGAEECGQKNPERLDLKIEPLFADDMEFFQVHRSFYNSLLASGKLWRTGDMTTLATTCAFLSEVELYLHANTHLKNLHDEQKRAFVEHYNKWLAGYKQKIEQPFFDTDGVTPLEGTMVVPMYPGRRDDLIQEFLQTIPNLVKVSKEQLYTEKDFEYVGK